MAIKSNAAKREAGKVSAKKNTKATVKPSRFTNADWAAIYNRMAGSGLFPASFVTGEDGVDGVMLMPYSMFIPIPEPTFRKIHKSNA